jgi:hypothetical protein
VATNNGFEPLSALYSVTPGAVGGCLGETQNFLITVNPKPVTSPVEDMVYCNGVTAPVFYFTANIPNAFFEWEFVNKAGSTMIPGIPASGQNYIPAFEAFNNDNKSLIGKYRVRASYTFDNVTCFENEWKEFNIIILPTPNITVTPVYQTVCSGQATEQVVFTSNLEQVNYKWKRVSGIIPELPVEGTGNFNSFTIANTGITPIEVIYEVTPVFNPEIPELFCQGSSSQFSITVLPTPEITSNFHVDPICSNSLFKYSVTTSFHVNNISWVRLPHPDINSNTGASGNNAYIIEELVNSGTSDVTVKYLISLSTGSCVYENIAEISVVVMPGIELSITPVTLACHAETSVSIPYEINVLGALYTLVFDIDATGEGFNSITNFTPLPQSALNVSIPQGVREGNYGALLTVKLGQCEKTYPVIIAIKSGFAVTEISEPEIYLCENENLYLLVKTDGNVQYQWYFEGYEIEDATSWAYETVFNIWNEGTYTVEIWNDCSTQSYSFNVHKNPLTIERKYSDIMYVDNYGDKYVSYQWYKNGHPITIDGQWQYYTEKGGFTCHAEYNVKAYKADGTYDEACPIVPNDCSGSGEYELVIYPNPTTNGTNITISLKLPDGEQPMATATLYDMTGKKVATYSLTDYQTQIAVNFATGTYVMKISTVGGKEFIEKLIIKNN